MRPATLLRLYPRAWRERYGEEFLATAGEQAMGLQRTIDVVSGAIDAWLSADVRRATMAPRVIRTGGMVMLLKSVIACEQRHMRLTKRDSWAGAGVMVGASLLLIVLGTSARRGGMPIVGDFLVNVAFPASWMLSMPFWLMKDYSRAAKVLTVGGTLIVLLLAGILADG